MNASLIALVIMSFVSHSALAENLTKRQVKRITNQIIDQRAPELVGPQGIPGPPGPAGISGQQFIYAKVSASGVIDPAQSFGVEPIDVRQLDGQPPDLNHPYEIFEHAYCFNISGAHGAHVTMDALNALIQSNPLVSFMPNAHGCTFMVHVFDIFSGKPVPGGFYITIY